MPVPRARLHRLRVIPVAAALLAMGLVGGCVQAPVSNSNSAAAAAGDGFDDGSSGAYVPANVPVYLPSTGVSIDPDNPPPYTNVTPEASPTKAVTTAKPVVPATRPPTTAPVTTQVTTAKPVTTAPATTAQATTAPATTDAHKESGPGVVSMTCTRSYGGGSKGTLRWENRGFSATVTVNGRTVVSNNKTETSLSSTQPETTRYHGTCVGTVGGVTATGSY